MVQNISNKYDCFRLVSIQGYVRRYRIAMYNAVQKSRSKQKYKITGLILVKGDREKCKQPSRKKIQGRKENQHVFEMFIFAYKVDE